MNGRIDLLQDTVWARELTPGELDRARRGISEKSFSRGSYVCHRGDKLDYWNGVVSGLVKMSAVSVSGKAITFAGLGVGAWFGEGSLLKDEARKYDLFALADSTVLFMPRANFMWLYENSTGFNRFLVRQLNERIGQFISAVENDRIQGPKVRVARHISWLFNPVLYPHERTHIDIGQEELALLAGLSRQAASKALQSLESEGLLGVEHGRIVVHDLGAMRDYEEE